MSRLSFRPVALALALVAFSTDARATGTFDATNEGWVIVSYPFRSHVPTPATVSLPFDVSFGNPAGSVRVGDVYAETGIAAPATYLGDRSAAYGGSLTYDIFLRFTDGVTYPAAVLNGGTMSVYYDAPSPTLNTWEHRAIPLTESGWRVSNTQVAATQTQFQSVLQNLVGLYIYTEWHTGEDDTNVDNVTFPSGITSVTPGPLVPSATVTAFPNPFTRSTRIAFTAAHTGRVDVQIFDVHGHVVRGFVVSVSDAREQTVAWDGRDRTGAPAAPGIYYCRVSGASGDAVARLALLR